MMKKKLVLSIFILLILSLVYLFFEQQRFSVLSPMEDYEYKKEIIKNSKNITYKLENLRILLGPEELAKFIKENDNNSQIYTPSKNNVQKNIYSANLHMHTTNSDGAATVEFLLDQAQLYAESNLKGGFFYLAITDHNTVLGAKEVIRVLQKNPDKYKNIKVATGIEIFSGYKNKYSEKPVDIHVLAWCINPYDKFLNKEFYKKDKNNKWNRTYPDPDFEKVVEYMSERSIVGIAHPARYLEKTTDKKAYIKDLFRTYKSVNKNQILFTEGYYQSNHLVLKPFDDKTKEFLKYINNEAKDFGIIRTGSTDVHGYSIFRK